MATLNFSILFFLLLTLTSCSQRESSPATNNALPVIGDGNVDYKYQAAPDVVFFYKKNIIVMIDDIDLVPVDEGLEFERSAAASFVTVPVNGIKCAIEGFDINDPMARLIPIVDNDVMAGYKMENIVIKDIFPTKPDDGTPLFEMVPYALNGKIYLKFRSCIAASAIAMSAAEYDAGRAANITYNIFYQDGYVETFLQKGFLKIVLVPAPTD